jgi:hypothetical protein
MNSDEYPYSGILGPLKKRLYSILITGFSEKYPEKHLLYNLSDLVTYPYNVYKKEIEIIFGYIKKILIKPYIIDQNYRPSEFDDIILTNNEKEDIINEIKNYKKELDKYIWANNPNIIDEKIENHQKKRKGRKLSNANFIGTKLTDDRINKLYYLSIPLSDNGTLFEHNETDKATFLEIMKTHDLRNICNKGYKIKLAAGNAIFSYVLTWLEKNNYLKSPLLAVENSKSFYSSVSHNTVLKRDNLQQAKKKFNSEKDITTFKPMKKPIITDQNDKQYFLYLNYRLHNTFK